MDWELKATSWDFSITGTEDDHYPHLAALVGSSRLRPNNNEGDFSVDLHLGRLADDKGKGQKYLSSASSPSRSSKRARGVSVVQNVTCIVDRCVADLSGCREYHRRHRVCESHSKTPVVSVAGKELRFCQQCSRFQSLAEFDGEKRSCRKRLDGHNRRRRKPQPESFDMNHGSSFSNHQGARLMHFGRPETYITWPIAPHTATFPSPSITIQNGEEKGFPFLLANETEKSNRHLANTNHDRVHSLLSSPRPIQMGPTAFNLGFTPHQLTRLPALVPQDSTYGYSGNEVTVVSLSPDDLLEKGAAQVLPFVW